MILSNIKLYKDELHHFTIILTKPCRVIGQIADYRYRYS